MALCLTTIGIVWLATLQPGKKGCACDKSRGDGEGGCDCKVKPFLDEQGNYSLDLLRIFDPSWADQVEKGLPWELLDPIMDTEEPEGALIISIALNKRNEAAMQTGHTEVMKTLVGLCKPDPHDGLTVLFEPVREKND